MPKTITSVCSITLILTFLCGGTTFSPVSQTRDLYISPKGQDENDGSLNNPWRTIDRALEQLRPGDILNFRAGRYFEHEVTIDLEGSNGTPITFRAYPGEQVIIDGGLPDFLTAPNNKWELLDPDIALYRSVEPISGEFAGAWLVNEDRQLVQYEKAENLESTYYGPVDGFKPIYMGPGLQLRNDGHLYIRLQHNPNDLSDSTGHPINPVPANTNPNNLAIAVYTSENIFILEDAGHLHFQNLIFAHSKRIIDARDGTHNIEFEGCTFNYGSYGFVIRSGVHDWEIHDCQFNNGLPDYVYWTDVKNSEEEVAEAYPEFQSVAIEGAVPDFFIHDNQFFQSFDGVDLKDGSDNLRLINNIFRNMRDDAINLSRGMANVEVAHNLLWRVGAGIANLGSNAQPGHVYIHHNVIDNSAYQRGGRPGNYREEDWPVWMVIDPFASHDQDEKSSWWKLYNNTIVTRIGGYEYNAAGPTNVSGNSEKYVYNNIFYALDDRVIFRDDQAALGTHYEGNVVYQRSSGDLPLFLNFGDGEDYDSLTDFKENSGTDWERQGLSFDPGFNPFVLQDPSFEPAEVWERYRPANPLAGTIGASYENLNWPETDDIAYRGALPPGEWAWQMYLPVIVKK